MSATLLGSPWESYVDLNPADKDALTDPGSLYTKVGPKINGSGSIGTMGHFCYFNMDGDAHADYTHHFDFPIHGDFTIAVNALAATLPNATTVNVSVQGSVDGENYVDLHNDIMSGIAIDDTVAFATYDYDTKGKAPHMRLEITAASNASNETILLAIIPHTT